ncbi:MAG: NHL repeat-containing protein [Candidatus Omnitrophota bacterium]
MKRLIIILIVVIILVIGVVIGLSYPVQRCKYKGIVAKSVFGKTGSGLGEFNSSCGLAIKGDYLFVAECGNRRIQTLKINTDGSLSPQFVFGKKGKDLGEFDGLLDLAIKDNYLFIGDASNSRIQVLKINSDGSLSSKSSYGEEGKELGEFGGFTGLSLSIEKINLFVGDSLNSRIQTATINQDGSLDFNFTFGKEGQGLGEFGRYSEPFSGPGAICLVSKGDHLYVADSGNSRLQVMEIKPEGNIVPKFSFGKEGDKLGEFAMPFDLTIEGDYLFVADLGNARIQVLKIEPNGKLIPKLTFRKEGNKAEEFGIIASLAVKGNYIYVADGKKNCIHILELIY